MTKYIIIGEYPVEAFESGEANIEDYRDDYKVLAVCSDMDELIKEYRRLERYKYQDLTVYEIAREINPDVYTRGIDEILKEQIKRWKKNPHDIDKELYEEIKDTLAYSDYSQAIENMKNLGLSEDEAESLVWNVTILKS